MPNVFGRLFRCKPQATRASAQPTDALSPLGPMLAGLPLAECASRHAPHDAIHPHQADCSSSDSASDSGSSDGGSGSCD